MKTLFIPLSIVNIHFFVYSSIKLNQPPTGLFRVC